MNTNKIVTAVATAIIILTGFFAYSSYQHSNESLPNITVPSQTSSTTTEVPAKQYLQYGKVTLKVGETARFKDSSITLLRVTDDSRCATGLTCIWAGTVKAEVLSVSGMGTSTEKIELGKSLTTEAEKIEVLEVSPYPKKDDPIESGEYKVIFNVTKRVDIATVPSQGACYIGGCSSQVCSDEPGVASNCEYREVYACYRKNSTCERQANGACGWTDTKELQACIIAADRVN